MIPRLYIVVTMSTLDKSANSILDFTREPDFESILTNPILDIAARFWDEERYLAFQVCYRSMRVIDDLVDDRKATGLILTAEEIARYGLMIEQWTEALSERRAIDDFQQELMNTIDEYSIPIWPWQRLAMAMKYDLTHDGFVSFLAFLRYSEGAAISPASIFMHLCGVRKSESKIEEPVYDIRLAARPLAIFSYLVHIMRDFEMDQKSGLNYFADGLLRRFELKREALFEIASGETATPQFRLLMKAYHRFAGYYRQKARRSMDSMLPHLEPRYRLSLEIIYSLYDQIYERIDPEKGGFSQDVLNPSPKEVRGRIESCVEAFELKN